MNIEISEKQYEKFLSWDDAILYCSLLVIDGKDDWRLPTIKELYYIYVRIKDDNDFDDVFYWSSLEYYEDVSWGFEFEDGSQHWYAKRNKFYVRAVRDSRSG
jgi:hypothetical protein